MEMNPLAFVLAFVAPFKIRDMFVPAYLDAGTGSLIFQVLVASLVSAGVVFGGVMSRLRSFFSRVVLRREPDAAAVESQPSATQPAIDAPPEQHADGRLESWKPDGQRKAA